MAADPQKSVERIRAQIDALRAKIEQNGSPRLPWHEAMEKAAARVDDLAEDFRLDIGALFTPGERFTIPIFDYRDLLPLIAWINPDAMKERIRGALEEAYEGYAGPTDTPDQRDAVKKMQAELFDLEVKEERAILESERMGKPVVRRMDANPEAVLAA